MSSSSPVSDDRVAMVVKRLRSDYGDNLQGALLAGSAVVNAATAHDIDVCVLIRDKFSHRRRVPFEESYLDLFVSHPSQARRDISAGRKDFLIHMYANGRVIHAPDSTIYDLKELAKDILSRRRPRLSPVEQFESFEHLHDLLQKYAKTTDRIVKAYIISQIGQACVRSYFKRKRYWYISHDAALSQIQSSSPEMYCLLERALTEPTTMSVQEARYLVHFAVGPRRNFETAGPRYRLTPE